MKVGCRHLNIQVDQFLGFGSIGVFCDPSSIASVAHQLAAMPEIRFLAHITGRCAIQAAGCFRSRQDLLAFLRETIGKVSGIQRIETLDELQVVKRDYYFSDPAGN